MKNYKIKRIKWPLPDNKLFKKYIFLGDKKSLRHRLKNHKFIWREFGPPIDMLLVGGIPSMFAIRELKTAYINGCYMATILLAQAFIEHSLGGAFLMGGCDSIVEKGFAMLIKEALVTGQISKELSKEFDELRKMRNPYIHPNPGLTSRSHMGRMKKKETWDPEILAEQDAKRAIEIVVDYLRHGSPDWKPERAKIRRRTRKDRDKATN